MSRHDLGAVDRAIIRSRRERIDDALWRERFAGRTELRAFLESAVTAEPPVVLALSGLGGMGKSFLLRCLHPSVHASVSAGPNARLNFQAGETDTNVAGALLSVARQLNGSGLPRASRFGLLYAEWFERSHGQPLPRTAVLNEDVAQIVGVTSSLDGVPFVGTLTRTAGWVFELAQRGLDARRRNQLEGWFAAQPEVDEYLTWPELLTQLTLGELELLMPRALAADIADAHDELRPGGQRGVGDRAIIVIDTYERIADTQAKNVEEIVPTFVEELAEAVVSENALCALVVAGRDPLLWGWSWEPSAARFVPDAASVWAVPADADDPATVDAQYIARPVDVLAPQEVDAHLRGHRGLSEVVAAEVRRLAEGYPLAIGLATDLALTAQDDDEACRLIAGGDDQGDALAGDRWTALSQQLLLRLIEQLRRLGRRDLESLLRNAAVARYFDRELMLDVAALATSETYTELMTYSFVTRLGADGRCAIHGVPRQLLRDAMRRDGDLVGISERLAAAALRRSDAADTPVEHFAWQVESLFHRAAIDGIAGLLALDDLFEDALSDFRRDDCVAILNALDDLRLEDRASSSLASLMRARLARATSDYPLATAAIERAEAATLSADGFLHLRILRESSAIHRLAGRPIDAHARLDSYERVPLVGESGVLQGLAAFNRAHTFKDTDRIAEAKVAAFEAQRLLGTLGPGDEPYLRGMGATKHATSGFAALQRLTGRLAYLTGDYTSAIESFEAFLERAEEGHAAVLTTVSVGHVLRQIDLLDAALAIAIEVAERMRADHEPRGVSTALILHAAVLLDRGDDAEARPILDELLDDGTVINPYGPMWAHLGLAEAARCAGDPRAATSEYRTVIEQCRAVGSRSEEAYARIGIGLLSGRDDVAEALRQAERVRDLAEKCASPWMAMWSDLIAAHADSRAAPRHLDSARRHAGKMRRRRSDRDPDAAAIRLVENLGGSGDGRLVRPRFL